jgi:hypothetical protein
MKRFVVLFAGILMSFTANAADSCALQSARLLSKGKLSELALKFAKQNDQVSRSLEQLAAGIGPVKKVSPIKHQSSGESVRQTVAVEGLAASYPVDGSWAEIVTKSGDRFQLQASSEPGFSCKLLALHLDKFSK